jgi:hypothetical protein
MHLHCVRDCQLSAGNVKEDWFLTITNDNQFSANLRSAAISCVITMNGEWNDAQGSWTTWYANARRRHSCLCNLHIAHKYMNLVAEGNNILSE